MRERGGGAKGGGAGAKPTVGDPARFRKRKLGSDQRHRLPLSPSSEAGDAFGGGASDWCLASVAMGQG